VLHDDLTQRLLNVIRAEPVARNLAERTVSAPTKRYLI
jgi:hypothetical protein